MKAYRLIGEKFGRLTVLRDGESKKVKGGTRKYWVCECDCGNIKSVITASLVMGKTKSCGCLRREVSSIKRRGSWKGGRHVDQEGYVRIWLPEHPNAAKSGYIREHRLIHVRDLGPPVERR